MLILRRLYSRRISSSRYLIRGKKDPGISHQKKIIAETQENIEQFDFEELESDFTSVHKSHREHLKELELRKEKEKYLIVKQKYFKEIFPNFLTWHDKEQIRYLHHNDPEEWSIEKLSEGFPALPNVIEKIVKNKWDKKNQAKIAAHDRSVIQHWKDFKQGKLNSLPVELKEHLQRFSNRALNFKPFELSDDKGKTVHNISENKIPGEFSEIIASYQKLKRKNEAQESDSDVKYITNSNIPNTIIEDVHFKDKHTRRDTRPLTFKELQQKVETDMSRGKNVSETEKLILKETRLSATGDFNTTITLKPENISNILEHRHQINNDKVGFVRKTTRDMSHLIYPEKIIIPKNCYKKGYTYKLNDCYYDCEGEFLYRVPGMD